MYEKLKGLLADTVPDFELRLKAEIAAEINRVKVEKNAVILGHNYLVVNLLRLVSNWLPLQADIEDFG